VINDEDEGFLWEELEQLIDAKWDDEDDDEIGEEEEDLGDEGVSGNEKQQFWDTSVACGLIIDWVLQDDDGEHNVSLWCGCWDTGSGWSHEAGTAAAVAWAPWVWSRRLAARHRPRWL